MPSEGEWVAERTLVAADGQWRASLGRPAPSPGHEYTDWSCAYALCGPDRDVRRSVVGLDSFQSLLLALASLSADAKMLGCRWVADGKEISSNPELMFPDLTAS